jgi:hypothetical protein
VAHLAWGGLRGGGCGGHQRAGISVRLREQATQREHRGRDARERDLKPLCSAAKLVLETRPRNSCSTVDTEQLLTSQTPVACHS